MTSPRACLIAATLAALAVFGHSAAIAASRQVTLAVPTMDCATCPLTIKAALVKVHGVSRATVSYARRTAVVTYDDAEVDVAALTRATDSAGYPSFVADRAP